MATSRKKNLKYNLIFIICLAFLMLIIYSFSKDFFKNYQIDQEIAELEQEIYQLKQKNIKLAELIKYFDSESYAEQKARLELGLIKPGESTVIIPLINQKTAILPNNKIVINSNVRKWWQYFFGN